jgi:hypothetical protein
MLMTDHAECRSQQRGVQKQAISLILALADRTTHIGSGAIYKFVSRSRIVQLREAGLISAVCDRLRKTGLVIDPSTGTIITVIKGGDITTRRYRKGRWTHQRQ